MFVSFAEAEKILSGRSVAIVGSGPSCLSNAPGFVDSHDVVVRVNNYKTGEAQGKRCDVFYSFFGGSIRKTPEELKSDGVFFCMSKVPNSKPLESSWHAARGKSNGVDFRYIYRLRADWWFCPVFVPDDEWFLRTFNSLGKRIPTTGFSAICDVLRAKPASLYLTGFDFFSSRVHNVNEPWHKGDPTDPIGHAPEREAYRLATDVHPCEVTGDAALTQMLASCRRLRGIE